MSTQHAEGRVGSGREEIPPGSGNGSTPGSHLGPSWDGRWPEFNWQPHQQKSRWWRGWQSNAQAWPEELESYLTYIAAGLCSPMTIVSGAVWLPEKVKNLEGTAALKESLKNSPISSWHDPLTWARVPVWALKLLRNDRAGDFPEGKQAGPNMPVVKGKHSWCYISRNNSRDMESPSRPGHSTTLKQANETSPKRIRTG